MSNYVDTYDYDHDYDRASLRAETPEPSSVQGRRNVGIQLLDDEGGMSEQFEACLKHIFAKYCTPRPSRPPTSSPSSPERPGTTSTIAASCPSTPTSHPIGLAPAIEDASPFAHSCDDCEEPSVPQTQDAELLTPPPNAYFTSAALDEWARDTNGAPFSDETKEELVTFLDCNDDGNLTLKGFIQIYQLQTESDEEETWRDLSSHGFDRALRLVNTRREDEDNGHHDIVMS